MPRRVASSAAIAGAGDMRDGTESTSVHYAEQAVLSAVLMASETLDVVARVLTPADFALKAHSRIFAAMIALTRDALHVDVLTVSELLEQRGELAAVGGKDYLAELIDAVPTPAHVESHAQIVRDRAQRRELALSLEQGAMLAREGRMAPTALAASVRANLQNFERLNGTAPVRFALLDDEEIAAIPTPAWLIEGVLPSHALAVVFATPKSFKSFLVLDWACHIALGLDWDRHPVKRGPVVYCYAEGITGIKQRVMAWKRHAGVAERIGVYFLPRRVGVNSLAEARELLEEIQRTVKPTPVLIIIDTVARCLDGNENSSEDMSAFVRGCDLLRDGTGATVVAVHHAGLAADGRLRGSSTLGAACDAVIRCSRHAERLTIESIWMKDAPEFAPLYMEALEVAPSLVLTPSGVSTGCLQGQKLHCLTVLHECYTELGTTHKAWHESTALSSSSFDKARKWLKDNGFVICAARKWKLTDNGRLALVGPSSTRSTATPLPQSGVESCHSTQTGGYVVPPVVEQDSVRSAKCNDEARSIAGSCLRDCTRPTDRSMAVGSRA